ncbi:hypothetical protein [Stutzerimonas stutzeri]|uniref:secretion/conjugation apparatus DotM-related subunit n=1 Tax=Stutzerimonas stutzeri TaxID=316 RepID=UPI0015E2B3D5|nr:hypothetical protein [Stutzerimonas stutzeri]MBA1280419.1 hypothetical protein [Stutzerimonas stutzeri]
MADNGEASRGMMEFVFFGFLTVGLAVGMWFALRSPIMWVSFFSSYHVFGVYEHLPWLMSKEEFNNIVVARKAIPTLNPTQYGLSSLTMLFEYHGYVWRWIVIPMLLLWGWKTRKGVVRFKFKREISDVYKLIDIQAQHFPASAIIKGKNLLSRHPYEGPWATYTLPLDFALDNQLLWTSKQAIDANDAIDERTMMPIPPFTLNEKLQPFPIKRKKLPSHQYVGLHIDRANDVFAKQLGPAWKGHDGVPPLERALYAAFCTQAAGEQGKAWKLIEQLAFSFKEGTRDKQGRLLTPHYADIKGVDQLLAAYGNTPFIKQIHQLHAHQINVMVATLKAARKKGRLMHSNFLWLKPVNRTLWYALCGQGGQSPYWEAAGPWAHAEVETLMGRKITVPLVAGAVEALRELMSREHWIDPGEFSEAAQQRQVAEANALIDAERERSKAGQGSRQNMFGGNNYRQPPKKTTRKEDEEP